MKSNLIEKYKEIEIGKIAKCLDGNWILSENMSKTKEIGIVQLKHIGEGKFLHKKFNFITNDMCNKLKCAILEDGDLLVSRMAEPICRSCILPKLKFQTVTVVDVTIIRPNIKLVVKNFLNLIFNSDIIKHQTIKYTTGSTRSRISRKNLEKLKIPLPTLEYQNKIVSVLEKVEKAKQMRKESDELTKEFLNAVFLEMFGEPKKNRKWQEKSISEITKSHDSKRIPIKLEDREKRHGDYPYYGASGIIDAIDDYLFDFEAVLIGEDGANLIARSSPIAFIAKGKYWVNNHAHVLTPTEQTNHQYLTYFVNSIDLRPYLTGSAQPKLTASNLGKIKIPIPPIDLQNKFAFILKEIEKIKEQQTQSKEHIDDLFNNVMQKIFKEELTC